MSTFLPCGREIFSRPHRRPPKSVRRRTSAPPAANRKRGEHFFSAVPLVCGVSCARTSCASLLLCAGFQGQGAFCIRHFVGRHLLCAAFQGQSACVGHFSLRCSDRALLLREAPLYILYRKGEGIPHMRKGRKKRKISQKNREFSRKSSFKRLTSGKKDGMIYKLCQSGRSFAAHIGV